MLFVTAINIGYSYFMRKMATVFLILPVLSACASTSYHPISIADMSERYSQAAKTTGTTQDIDITAIADARQRDLRNAQARVWLAEARLDRLGIDPDATQVETLDEMREFFAAREDLRRLRAHYGATDSGFEPRGWHPLVFFDWRNGLSEVGTIHQRIQGVRPAPSANSGPIAGEAMPLSAIRR